jgi:protein-tyrosine phosphatase
MEPYKILFVCMGNICRSPMAEAVMQRLVDQAGQRDAFSIDSAGILDFHEGELPDFRMRSHAARRGYQLTHCSRPVRKEDFYRFDLIIGMDDSNMNALERKAPSYKEQEKLRRMTNYCTRFAGQEEVPDPYYRGEAGFEYVIDLLEDACKGLLRSILLHP